MSLYPCDQCGQRAPGKLAQATWAWWTAANERLAYRQRVCVTCFARYIAPLEVATREFSATCPVCGIGTDGDMDPVYLTVYVPSVGPVRLEMACCALHAAELRIRCQDHGTRLEDRSVGASEPSPHTIGTEAWSALGIEPRAA